MAISIAGEPKSAWPILGTSLPDKFPFVVKLSPSKDGCEDGGSCQTNAAGRFSPHGSLARNGARGGLSVDESRLNANRGMEFADRARNPVDSLDDGLTLGAPSMRTTHKFDFHSVTSDRLRGILALRLTGPSILCEQQFEIAATLDSF